MLSTSSDQLSLEDRKSINVRWRFSIQSELFAVSLLDTKCKTNI